MNRHLKIILPVIFLSVVVLYTQILTSETDAQNTKEITDVVYAEGIEISSTVNSEQQHIIHSIIEKSVAFSPASLAIDYPLDGSQFPPEFIAPRFFWHDSSADADSWLIDITFDGSDGHLYVLTTGDELPELVIDPECVSESNELPKWSPGQASATTWLPGNSLWEHIKRLSTERTATLTITGFNNANPEQILSRGSVRIVTSADSIGAAIFYRDVPLMPAGTEEGSIKPLDDFALPLIAWRLKDVSHPDSRVVLTGMHTCANCHSFSRDGSTFAMDVDGPSSDKGAYAITDIEPRTVIEHEEIISWNYLFSDKPKGKKTIGFLSQISPDGRYVVTTLNEDLYVENYLDYRFLQVFYPTRGILGYYDTETQTVQTLPGADDPAFVHCDPAWSPDGEYLVFARATAKDPYRPGQKAAPHADSPDETPMQYDLYRIPFNDGKGGTPEPITGASANGMSNTFPKVTPDGKYIIFVKCRNGQLMRPDSRLWIVPAAGGQAREMTCNTRLMNSWHSISPNGRWMVFSSKANTPYTQLFLTHLNEDGSDSPAILIPGTTADNRAANIPEFVPVGFDDFNHIEIPDVAYKEHLDNAVSLFNQGKLSEALEEFNTALSVNTLDEKIQADIYRTMGVAYFVNGRIDDALEHFDRALAINPDLAETQVDRGVLFESIGRYQDAVTAYTKALALNPRNVKALMNLASLKLSDRDPSITDTVEARELIQKACDITYYRDPLPLLTLANADAYAGEFDIAIERAEQARYFAEMTGYYRLIPGIDAHLREFRNGRPFRL